MRQCADTIIGHAGNHMATLSSVVFCQQGQRQTGRATRPERLPVLSKVLAQQGLDFKQPGVRDHFQQTLCINETRCAQLHTSTNSCSFLSQLLSKGRFAITKARQQCVVARVINMLVVRCSTVYRDGSGYHIFFFHIFFTFISQECAQHNLLMPDALHHSQGRIRQGVKYVTVVQSLPGAPVWHMHLMMKLQLESLSELPECLHARAATCCNS